MATGEYVQALSRTIDPDTGAIAVPQAQQLVAAIQIAADVEAAATAVEVLRALMPPEATLSVADQNRIDRARSLEDKLKVNFELAVNAGVAVKSAEIRKSAMADARSELAAANKTAELRRAEEVRNGGVQPTVRGVSSAGSASGWTSQYDIDTAHMEGRLSSAQVNELRRNGTYSRLPSYRE